MDHRIAIVYPFPNLDTVPSLTGAADLLADEGYRVDVYTLRDTGFPSPAFSHPAIELLYDVPRARRRGIHQWLPRKLSRPLQVLGRHRKLPYLCAIAVDPQGLLRARHLFRLVKVPVAYYSLELLLLDELASPRQRAWKAAEYKMGADAPFAIVQDPARAALLGQSTGIPPERVVLVPNAPLGPARNRASDIWHRRFDLPKGERVVLHAGSIDPWTGVDDLVASTWGWPPGFVLVIHTRFAAEASDVVQRLRRLGDPTRVRWSLQPVSRTEYDELVDGADIGLAFYEPATERPEAEPEENLRTIGLSSGKIAYYLRAGMPVVVNDSSSIGALVRQEGCGITVSGAQEIGGALATIGADLEYYRSRALTTFDRHFDFARGFAAVLERLARLAGKES